MKSKSISRWQCIWKEWREGILMRNFQNLVKKLCYDWIHFILICYQTSPVHLIATPKPTYWLLSLFCIHFLASNLCIHLFLRQKIVLDRILASHVQVLLGQDENNSLPGTLAMHKTWADAIVNVLSGMEGLCASTTETTLAFIPSAWLVAQIQTTLKAESVFSTIWKTTMYVFNKI